MNLFSVKRLCTAFALMTSLILPVSHAQTTDLLDKIKSNGVIRIGLEGTYPPFNSFNASGKLEGFEVDFAEALGKELGVKVEFQPTKWDGLLGALEAQRIDAVVNQVTITDARKKVYDFSTPYTISGIQALVRANGGASMTSPADLAGKKVGVGLGTSYEKWLKENVPQAIIKTYDDDATKFQDLQIGRTDAILVDRLAAIDFVQKSNNTMKLSGDAFSRQESAIAIRQGNPKLLAALNQAIATMQKDGRLAAMSQKWFQADVTQ